MRAKETRDVNYYFLCQLLFPVVTINRSTVKIYRVKIQRECKNTTELGANIGTQLTSDLIRDN